MRPLILASTSRYRRVLMERLELPFTQVSPDYDERADEERLLANGPLSPEVLATELSRGKALSLKDSHPDAWILGSDQIPVIAGAPGEPPRMLHKPGTAARAVEQLMSLRGRGHTMITAVVLLDARTGEERAAVDRQTLVMRRYSRAEATAYVAAHQPLDCAGSYMVEGPGIKLFEKLGDGDYTGVIGFPLLTVTRLLREVGLLPADDIGDDEAGAKA